jgi:hypothetical protein
MENPHYPNEDEGPRILDATVVALSTLCVRLYVRIKMLDAVGCDVRHDLYSFGNCC